MQTQSQGIFRLADEFISCHCFRRKGISDNFWVLQLIHFVHVKVSKPWVLERLHGLNTTAACFCPHRAYTACCHACDIMLLQLERKHANMAFSRCPFGYRLHRPDSWSSSQTLHCDTCSNGLPSIVRSCSFVLCDSIDCVEALVTMVSVLPSTESYRDALIRVVLEHLQKQITALLIQTITHVRLHVDCRPLWVSVPATGLC